MVDDNLLKTSPSALKSPVFAPQLFQTKSFKMVNVIAQIELPNTPVVLAAQSLARDHLDDAAYNHVLRCAFLGFAISDRIPALQSRDRELHAVAAILHDLGWDRTKKFVSPDKRFEVDGANAARDFVLQHGGKDAWDERRTQLLWDAIALHTQPDIAWHKEAEVKATQFGVFADFGGPTLVNQFGMELSQHEWTAICEKFPRTGFKEGVKKALCGICSSKPATTADNFVGDFGDRYGVEGYSREGLRFIDRFMEMEE